jgi:ethanolamine transporter EutH
MNSMSLLFDGLADAAGFVGGSLLAFWLGRLFGLDIFEAGYSNSTIFAILLVGLGGGLGLQIARRLRTAQRAKQAKQAEEDN